MEAIDQKELLHLRIEQADDKLLEALVVMTEGLFKVYQPEALEATEEQIPSWAKPLTKEESLADLREGIAEHERGEYVSVEEMEKESSSW